MSIIPLTDLSTKLPAELHQLVQQLGFAHYGYTEDLEAVSWHRLVYWVERNYQGPLKYLADHRMSLREHLALIFPQVQSALVFLYPYGKINASAESERSIADYVLSFKGEDYHDVLKQKLTAVGDRLLAEGHGTEFKLAVDTLPILEKDLAYRAGLGWIGKNSLLINPTLGSYVLIASLLLDQKMPALGVLKPQLDHCGTCRRCLDACPTGAILEGERSIDAQKCISTFTIELMKDDPRWSINQHLRPNVEDQPRKEFFGCDICQRVCPWNHRVPWEELATDGGSISPRINLMQQLMELPLNDAVARLESMSQQQFKQLFLGTPLFRTGKKGLLKNLKWLAHAT